MHIQRALIAATTLVSVGLAPTPAGSVPRSDPPFVAASNDDATLHVDSAGRALFVEPAPNPLRPAATAAAPTGPTTPAVPALHSRPGAPITFYIDLDGGSLAGTGWDPAVPTTEVTGIDNDGDPTTFNATELEWIVLIWAHVAEDYAPFDIDVTTELPSTAAMHRDSVTDRYFGSTALIVAEVEFVTWCGCGGLAYLGALGVVGDQNFSQPALVFTGGGAWNDPKILGESVAHELGHHAGLDHDGIGLQPYAIGADGWAPIMGLGYGQPLTQWSRGEYLGATDTSDDYATMRQYGVREMADDHGDTRHTATRLRSDGWLANGVIAAPDDQDSFSFTTRGGSLRLTVRPVTYAANLDVRVTIRRFDGTVVARIDPPMRFVSPTRASGLRVHVADLQLRPGRYWIIVDGTGGGSGDTAYSDYGSVGRYAISGRVRPGGA